MATWTNPLMRPSIARRRERTGKADDGMGCGDGSDWPAAAEWDLGRGGTTRSGGSRNNEGSVLKLFFYSNLKAKNQV
jgi:hypothetical protein